MSQPIRLFESFAGYGGASFALKRAGIDFECVGYSEIDKFAIKCYEQNHSGKNYGDCTKIDPHILPDFDLLTAGFPCQAFSVAGNMRGEADPRGTLFNEIIRVAEVKKPRLMLLENVKGLISKKFKATFDKILSELERIGYVVNWKVLNTKDYGIPQSRARVWFVCIRKDLVQRRTFSWPNPESLKIFIKDILECDVSDKYCISDKLQERFREYLKNKQTSIAAMRQRDRHNRGEERQQQLEFREDGCSNSLTSVEKDNLLCINTQPRSGRGQGGKGTISNNHVATSVDAISSTVVLADCYDVRSKDEFREYNCASNTLKSRMGTGGNNVPIVVSERLRRLTPRECFRLMGFLKDEIKLDGISDSQCYKLAGNGWALEPASLILKEMLKLSGLIE